MFSRIIPGSGSASLFLKKHGIAILLALAAGILTGAPSALAPLALGPAYQGVPFLYQDNESLYLARVHDVLDGHPSLGSPFLYENKDMPTALPPTGEYVYALLSTLTFLPLNTIIFLSKFLFPLALFLLFYAFAYVMARDLDAAFPRITALATASIGIFGSDFLQLRYILSVIASGPSALYLNEWTRLVNPTTGGIFLIAFYLAVWAVLKKNAYWPVVVAGVMLGAMTGYIFSFSMALVAIGILSIALFCLRRYGLAAKLAIAVGIGGLMNVFQIRNFFLVISSPDAHAFSLKNGLLLTHLPLLNKLLVLALLCAAITAFLMRMRRNIRGTLKDSELMIGAILISLVFLMNQQVITGKTIWPQHFMQYSAPLSELIILLSLSLWVSLLGSQRLVQVLWRFSLCVMIALSFAFGIQTAHSYKAVLPDYAEQQHYGPLFSWLNANAPRDCVVFAIEKYERLAAMVPALTGCNTYKVGAVFVGVPESRIEHNYLMWLRFSGLRGEDAEAYLRAHPQEFTVLLFSDWKELFRYNGNPWLESISDRDEIDRKYQEVARTLAADYRESLRHDFLGELTSYRLNYVVWDREEYPDWNPDAFPFLREVYENEDVHLYAVE